MTRLLQESLTGKTRTALIACATPSAHYIEETKSTLQFAQRAKTVKTCAEVNEILDDAAMLKRLRKDLKKAQIELESLREGNQNADTIEEMRVREKRSLEERERLEAQLSKLESEKAAVMRTVTNLKRSLLCSSKVSSLESHVLPSDSTSPRRKDHTKRRGSKRQHRETWCPGTSLNDVTFRAVQEFRHELDCERISKFQEEEEDPIENLDLMKLADVPELEIARFCKDEDMKIEMMSMQIQGLASQKTLFESEKLREKEEFMKILAERDSTIENLNKMLEKKSEEMVEMKRSVCDFSKQCM